MSTTAAQKEDSLNPKCQWCHCWEPLGCAFTWCIYYFSECVWGGWGLNINRVDFFLVRPCGMQDLSSLIRDRTLHWECGVLTTGQPGKSHTDGIFNGNWATELAHLCPGIMHLPAERQRCFMSFMRGCSDSCPRISANSETRRTQVVLPAPPQMRGQRF